MLKDDIKEHNKKYKSKTNFEQKQNSLSVDILNKLKTAEVIKDYYSDGNYTLINAECIEAMKSLIKKGVIFDHIIADIPYGTVQGLAIEGWKNKGNIPMWDQPIDTSKMLECCFNISKANSNLILFSQEPMTFKINYELNIFQKYSLSAKMIWLKNNHANGFSAKSTPLNYYEEMLLIRKCLDERNSIGIRKYFKDMLKYINLSKKEIMDQLGQGLDHCFRYANRTFYIPTETNYNALIEAYHIDKMETFIPYHKLKSQWDTENNSIFNLPNGEKIVKNIFSCKKDINNIHPTQKPIKLLTELIKIFSNPGDTILDFTCGSGSTGIAAVKCGRKFVGIELNTEFYNKALDWYKKTSM